MMPNRLTINNGDFRTFPKKIERELTLRQGNIGRLIVEEVSHGGYIAISPKGYKGDCDFAVEHEWPNGQIERTTHAEVLREFHRVLEKDKVAGRAFIDAAMQVVAGKEPPMLYAVVGTISPGDCILKILKWVLAQEDINYPIERNGQGRRMFADRLWEVAQEVPIGTVLDRADVKFRSPPDPLRNISYNYAVRSSLRR